MPKNRRLLHRDRAASHSAGCADAGGGLSQSFGHACRELRRALVAKRATSRRLRRRLRMLGYEWLLELCSLARTTVRLLCGEVPFLDLGPTYGPHRDSGLLMECTRTRGRIACMRNIWEERPHLSLNDTRLVLKGFDLGAEWTQNNPHFCTPHSGAHRKPVSCAAKLSKYWRGQW
jgi:hypothetical protein